MLGEVEGSRAGSEGLSQEDCQELKVSLEYIMNSRPGWTETKSLFRTKQIKMI